jgi:hypothetical protein
MSDVVRLKGSVGLGEKHSKGVVILFIYTVDQTCYDVGMASHGKRFASDLV